MRLALLAFMAGRYDASRQGCRVAEGTWMYGLRLRIRLLSALALWPLAAALLLLAAPSALYAGPVDEQYAIAAGHYAEQRYAPAIAEFRKLVNDHADHPLAANAQFFLAESLLQSGDFAAAAEAFNEFILAQPSHRFAAQASFRVGESAYLRGDYAAALPKLQAFVATFGNHKLAEYALPYLADCQLEAGDIQAAQKNYQASLKNHPAGALTGECRLGLARIAQQQGDLVEAERFYEFLALRDGTSTADEAKVRLGQLLYHKRDYAGAESYLQPLATSQHDTSQRTTARYWLGFVHLAEKQTPRAQAIWKQAIAEDADHSLSPAIALALAESLAADGKGADARLLCDRIAKEWKTSEQTDDALALASQLAFRNTDYDEVARLVEMLAKEHSTSPLLLAQQELLARAWIAQGKYEAAMARLAPLEANASEQQPNLLQTLALAQLGAKQYEAVLTTLGKVDLKEADDTLRAGVLMTQGSALVALGRGKEALVPLKAYLADYDDAADAAKCRAQLCVALVQAKQFQEASNTWQTLAKRHSTERTFVPTTLYLAEAAAEAGEHATARAWFESLANEDRPVEVRQRALEGLAWLAQQDKASPADSARLAELLKKEPASAQVATIALKRAQVYESNGERDNALAAYLEFIKDYATSPQLPDALLAAARLHDELAQDREALVLVERLLKEFPDYAHTDAAIYQAAWIFTDLDKREAAAKHFARLHDDYRQSTFWFDAAYRLAEHHVRAKRYDDANTVLAGLISAAPQEGLLCHALYLQGQAAASSGKWVEVSAPLTRLVHDYPQHDLRTLAEYWLAESEYRTGKLREAGMRLADLSTRVDGRTDAWLPMVPLRQAQVLAHEKRWQEAHDLAAAIATKYPEFRQQYEVDYLLGRALGALAKFDDARKAYDRVVQSSVGGRTETAAMAQWMIGETYFQQERYVEAIAAYHRVERLFAYERWQAAALLQAGKCHEAQGQYREAIGLYAQLLKDYSQTTFAQDASTRLRVAEQRASAAGNRVE